MSSQKKELEKIVGRGNVLDDEKILAQYSRDQSFAAPRMPDLVAFAETAEQIQQIVKLANESCTPLIPYSSGMNLHGAAIPDQGGIILNMSRMKKIALIDEENWYAAIEPGVTYRELLDTLAEKGFRVMVPFGAAPGRSVLTSYLERDPVMAAPSFEHGNYLIMDTELVLPNGELFRTGNWACGGAPGSPNGPIRNTVFRLWTAAQGTLGILTKMVVQIEPIQKQRKLFFIPFRSLADALEPIKQIQRREIGTECFLLNRFNLASMLTDSWEVPEAFPAPPADSEEFEQIAAALPPWALTVCINGNLRRAEEKIAYESEALKEVCDLQNLELLSSLPNIPGAETRMLTELIRPWSILKKYNYRGSVHDLTFKIPLKKAAQAAETLEALAREHGYPLGAIGMYLLPLERGRAVHCEFDLHCGPAEGSERDQVRALWMKASSEMLNGGAYFDRPYGPWAQMMYARAADYSLMLKKLKAETDPNNILNPGKLCFS